MLNEDRLILPSIKSLLFPPEGLQGIRNLGKLGRQIAQRADGAAYL
jgi:hypothetical protein